MYVYTCLYIQIWIPPMVVPQDGWFIMEIPTKMYDLGVPLFSETTICMYLYIYIYCVYIRYIYMMCILYIYIYILQHLGYKGLYPQNGIGPGYCSV